VAHWQAKFVGLPCRFPIQSKITHPARTAPLHLFFHAGMGNDEFAIVKNVMTDELVQEFRKLVADSIANIAWQ
jgi:hypothetical protein